MSNENNDELKDMMMLSFLCGAASTAAVWSLVILLLLGDKNYWAWTAMLNAVSAIGLYRAVRVNRNIRAIRKLNETKYDEKL